MSLLAAPTFTAGTTGNIYGSGGATSLAASATATTNAFYIGVAGQTGAAGSTTTGSAVGGRVQVTATAGTVATTNGLQVQVFSTSDGGTTYDTFSLGGANFVVTMATSSVATQSFDLSPGQYKIKLTNLDGTNGLTVVELTLGTIG